MSAIPSNSTTLENIPIEDTSTLEVSSSELIIAADNTNATEGIDTSSEEILSISTAIPPNMSNDTASIAEIDIDLDIGNGMSITEAPTLYNVTDAIDGFRTGRNLDFFPNKLASIIKNDPVAYIERYKLSINTFADEMVNHQQQYGLSECLFEPLQKIGEAFAIVYRQNPQKQALVNRYVQFISDLEKNASSVTPLNCSDTSNWSQTTTTQTPLSSTELTTAKPVTPPVNTTLSPDFTTETLQPTNSTTLRPNLNTTQNSNHDKTVPAGSLNNLFFLGGASAVHGAMSGVVYGITGSIYNYYDSKGRLNGWRKPLAQAGVMLANAMTIATLPAMLSTVENESEQSDPITKVLHSTAYSLGGSLILNGINYAGHKAYYYFNKKPMGKDSIVSKALDALPLAANTGLLINGGYSSTEAMVILGSNLLTAGLSSQVTQSVVSRIVNKTAKNKENDVETGSNNNIPLNNLNTNAVEHAFEQDDFNLDNQFQTLATEAFNSKNTQILDDFLNKLDSMPDFQVEKVCTKDLVEAAENQLEIAENQAKAISEDLKITEDEVSQKAFQQALDEIDRLLSSVTVTEETTETRLQESKSQSTNALKLFHTIKDLTKKIDEVDAEINTANLSFSMVYKLQSLEKNIEIHSKTSTLRKAKTEKKFEFKINSELLNEHVEALIKFLESAKISVKGVLKFLDKAKKPTSENISTFKNVHKLASDAKSLIEMNKKLIEETDKKLSKIQAFFLKNLTLIALQDPEIAARAYSHLLVQKRLLPTKDNLQVSCSIIPFTTIEAEDHQTLDGRKATGEHTTMLRKLVGSLISGLQLKTKNFKFESKIFKTKNNYPFEGINISCETNKILSILTPSETKQDPASSKLLFSEINELLEKQSKSKSDSNDKYINFLFVLPSKSTTAVVEIVIFPSSSMQKDKISVYNPDNLLKNELKKLTNKAKKYGYVANNNPEINSSHLEFRQHDSAYSFIKNSVKNYLKDCSLSNNASFVEDLNEPVNAISTEIQLNLGLTNRQNNLLASSELEVLTWNGVRFDEWSKLLSNKEITLPQTETGNIHYLIKFPSDKLIQGKIAVLAKQENNEHPLLSSIRNFLVYQVTNKPDKIVKKALLMGDLRELFSKFATIQKNNQETRVYSAKRPSFFSVPSSTTAAPVQPNHLMPGYK